MDFIQHLEQRGLSPDIRAWVDYEGEIVTFPLWGASGVLVGYQRYTWKEPKIRSNAGKYYTWITAEYKPVAVWGMEYILDNGGNWESPSLVVVEGIWDAISCIQCGYRACALLTATPNKQLIGWFRYLTMGQDVVAIKDSPNKKEQKSGLDKLANHAIMCVEEKDMGDHSPQQAIKFLSENI